MYPVYGHFIKMSVSMLPNFLPDPVENWLKVIGEYKCVQTLSVD